MLFFSKGPNSCCDWEPLHTMFNQRVLSWSASAVMFSVTSDHRYSEKNEWISWIYPSINRNYDSMRSSVEIEHDWFLGSNSCDRYIWNFDLHWADGGTNSAKKTEGLVPYNFAPLRLSRSYFNMCAEIPLRNLENRRFIGRDHKVPSSKVPRSELVLRNNSHQTWSNEIVEVPN
jgi:hypothetical protein